jgi:hypothetical protein
LRDGGDDPACSRIVSGAEFYRSSANVRVADMSRMGSRLSGSKQRLIDAWHLSNISVLELIDSEVRAMLLID